jgi:hypothetical protein
MRRQLASEKESVTPTSTTTTTIGVGGTAVKTVTPVTAAQPLTSTSAYMRDMEQLVEFLRSTGIEVPPRLVKVIERVINPDGSETVNIRYMCTRTLFTEAYANSTKVIPFTLQSFMYSTCDCHYC